MPSKNETQGAGKGAGQGAIAGAGTGAIVGSVVPGVGTAIGAGVGGVVGGVAGGTMGYIAGSKKDKMQRAQQDEAAAKARAAAMRVAGQYQGLDQSQQQIIQQLQTQAGGAADPVAVAQAIEQYKLSQQQDAMAQQISQFFQDPARATAYANYLQQQQAKQVDALKVNTEGQQRNDAFQTAASGQEGSSMQAERQANTAQQYQMGAGNIAANTAQQQQAWKQQQDQLRQYQLSQVYGVNSGGPGGMLAGLGQASGLAQDQAQTQANFGDIQQQGAAGLYTGLATGLNGLSNGIRASWNPYGAQQPVTSQNG